MSQTEKGAERPEARSTKRAALGLYSMAQRRLYSISLWCLPDGRFEAFPLGHPVPKGSVRS